MRNQEVKLKKVAIITSFPRAQRVAVYNEMMNNDNFSFNVFYLRSMPYGRHWKYGPKLLHSHHLVKELRIWKHLYLSPGLFSKFKSYKPDLMIMTQYASPGMQLLMYYCSIRKIPWIFWGEAPHVRYESAFVKNEFLRTLLRKIAMIPIKYFAKEVWGIGNRAISDYRQEFGSNKVYRNLPYFSDLTDFLSAGHNRIISDVPVFMFSGSLSYRKGADLFVKAIEELSTKGYRFDVIVLGVGEFRSLFDSIDVSENIRIRMCGFVQLNEVPDQYSRANILVFPSRHDGWGMTLPEGMAAGMAVISTPYTGCAVDTIKHKDNGLIVDTDTHEHLAAAMKELLDNPDLIELYGKRSRETIKQYTHIKGAEKFCAMINATL